MDIVGQQIVEGGAVEHVVDDFDITAEATVDGWDGSCPEKTPELSIEELEQLFRELN